MTTAREVQITVWTNRDPDDRKQWVMLDGAVVRVFRRVVLAEEVHTWLTRGFAVDVVLHDGPPPAGLLIALGREARGF